ncbi:UDP-N-acetylglucosamine 2-epimerase [Cognatishimia sp. 1_MG-2023]|uniref:UDP-N-acetylglucosamine 2-epimerase n=1 Tax=Cognatishimia sp. 1_MG-2023 TaxID=3062642 RepID=UPI0026E38E53|nr:UDP-N-acetylglucosamine 2-epimerase [Cognatishimia sp. 1_MG-2023]MDO6728358.1 UDP-N-acetylglucosamine 2-epimerase [Cognatishimia sp. 1_MG-2023]
MTRQIKVTYVTGTRADFGLLERSLQALHADDGIELTLLVTGQHLDARYGETINDVRASGLEVVALPALEMEGASGQEMARLVNAQMRQMIDYLSSHETDLLLLLGDRGEMMAAGLAAVFLGIITAHFHGGERSGTIDDQLRQAISSLSIYHFPATPGARERLIRQGETEESVILLGAPGLDGLDGFQRNDALLDTLCIDRGREIATVIFHPVVQDAQSAGQQAQTVLTATLKHFSGQVVLLAPNSDAGSAHIMAFYRDLEAEESLKGRLRIVRHLNRNNYLTLLEKSVVLIGNSSSGIIEAASLSTPVVNVGDRQNGRECSDSVFHCDFSDSAIAAALKAALSYDGSFANIYDQGGCAPHIVGTVKGFDLSGSALKKNFSY